MTNLLNEAAPDSSKSPLEPSRVITHDEIYVILIISYAGKIRVETATEAVIPPGLIQPGEHGILLRPVVYHVEHMHQLDRPDAKSDRMAYFHKVAGERPINHRPDPGTMDSPRNERFKGINTKGM